MKVGFLKTLSSSPLLVLIETYWHLPLISMSSKSQFRNPYLCALWPRLMVKEHLHTTTRVISISSTLKLIVISFPYRSVDNLSKRLSDYFPNFSMNCRIQWNMTVWTLPLPIWTIFWVVCSFDMSTISTSVLTTEKSKISAEKKWKHFENFEIYLMTKVLSICHSIVFKINIMWESEDMGNGHILHI